MNKKNDKWKQRLQEAFPPPYMTAFSYNVDYYRVEAGVGKKYKGMLFSVEKRFENIIGSQLISWKDFEGDCERIHLLLDDLPKMAILFKAHHETNEQGKDFGISFYCFVL